MNTKSTRAGIRMTLGALSMGSLLALAGCGGQPAADVAPAAPAAPAADGAAATSAFEWPASLRPFGDGYPVADSPCRRLGETSAVANYLDHTQDLVGCPGPVDSVEALALVSGRSGKVVDHIDGVTVLVVPRR